MNLLKKQKILLKRLFAIPKNKHHMALEVVPISNKLPPGRCRTIIYAVFDRGRRLGTAEVEYFQEQQSAIIHQIKVEEDVRKQGVASYLVGWIIAHTPYRVGTLYEYHSAYHFWVKMRNRHGWRMLPAPAMSG
ncbi:hypothetical protein AT959_08065 [Dechloromonas denitrificans]|uniref:N-acetyltransferase domain-containing protein n=1 Tax=Dechloromonas denitrificans TaxID=281362 RepID=A0A133XIB0_9RHOO|nr:acetyl-CoA sensor PanZ family protein [Dechloromonas denitrificans]KXB30684.1 hypothetical protein AT959_08065 [Dechloromonas denitrificans]